MSFFRLLITILSICLCLTVNASPKNTIEDENQTYTPVARRPSNPKNTPPPVIVYSAGIANPTDWPATFALGFPKKTDVNGDQFRTVCTATAVSKNVIITAAHCMRAFTAGAHNINSHTPEDFRLDLDGGHTVIKAYCDKPKGYELGSNSPKDWALCKLNLNLDISKFETLATQVKHDHRTSLSIILLGFGCIAFHDKNAQVYGEVNPENSIKKYNYGHKKYVHYDLEEHLYFGPSIVAENKKGFFITRKGALLCPGDSGGAAYTSSNKIDRRIIGINSQAKLGDVNQDESYIAQTTSQFFKFWALSWAIKNKVEICGINSNSSKCR